MFSTSIDREAIQEVREFLMSEDCRFVDNMNRAGLSFPAMALITAHNQSVFVNSSQIVSNKNTGTLSILLTPESPAPNSAST